MNLEVDVNEIRRVKRRTLGEEVSTVRCSLGHSYCNSSMVVSRPCWPPLLQVLRHLRDIVLQCIVRHLGCVGGC